MWYLPVIDRLKHLFSNARDAKLIIWHGAPDGHKKDGKLWHPTDAQQWKTFNLNHPEFCNDPRNMRFALSTDRMNPFDEMMNPYSTWPVKPIQHSFMVVLHEKVTYADYPCFWSKTS
jgi:hypothetical protein